LTKAEADEGWLLLHDGESNFGWSPASGSGWSAGGGVLAMPGNTAGGFLRTNTPFADFLLRFDVKAYAGDSNAGLLVRANREGNPNETGYEVQLGGGDAKWPAGSIVGHAKAGGTLPTGAWVPMEVEVNGGAMTVRSGDHVLATASGLLGQGGLIELESKRGGRLEIRNLRLKLLNPQSLFNGADLSGWKSTGTQPKKGGKVLGVFGGGKGKPKEVNWTAGAGQIHGEGGPGQLESAAPYGDFLFQAAVRIDSKKKENKRHYGLLLRGDAGQLGTGYEINLQPGGIGGIGSLGAARKPAGAVNQFAVVTVAAFNRHFEVWVDGAPVADADDVRAEGTNPAKEARVTPGAIAFFCPEENSNLDIRNVKVVQLLKTLGHIPVKPGQPVQAAQPQAPPPPPPVQPAAPATSPGYDAQMKAMQAQLQQEQISKMKEDEKKAKIASLLQQALKSDSPREQVVLYDQILLADPDNQVAFSARKEAQGKIDAENAKSAEETQKKAQVEAETAQKQQSFAANLDKAQAAFLGGNLVAADQALSAAERADPNDPRVRDLRTRLDAARGRTSSVFGVAALGAGAVLLGVLAWVFSRRRKKDPYLEIVEGLDKGKKFSIGQEVTHLGAISEDGGSKNEVVLRDAERMVSRFHCEIHFKDGKLYAVDIGSSNGTFVNKKRIPAGKPCLLKRGTRVSFGGTCTVKIGFERRSRSKQG
jgi:hypothetical protein